MQHPSESTTPTQGSLLFGTVNGAIGMSDICLFVGTLGKINEQETENWKEILKDCALHWPRYCTLLSE